MKLRVKHIKKFYINFFTLLILLTGMKATDVYAQNQINARTSESVMVKYSVHVQKNGWSEEKYNGESVGTVGAGLRLEGLRVKVANIRNYKGNIEYKSHIQTYGWEKEWKKNGEVSGTQGESKRLEAVQIRLTGELARKYDVYYRVHCQTFGWLDWAKNGQNAGSSGYGKRIEAIQIVLVDKNNYFSGNTGYSYLDKETGINYQTHVQTYGWQDVKSNGYEAGTTGQAKRLESINIKLKKQPCEGAIEYQTHVQTYGWEKNWRKNGQNSGTQGKGKRLEALRIRLTGKMAEKYDIFYRVHSQKFGWLGWAKNGENAGTEGYSYRLESIQILILPKNARSFTTGESFKKKNNAINENDWKISKINSSTLKTKVNSQIVLSLELSKKVDNVNGTYSWRNETTGEEGTLGAFKSDEKVEWIPLSAGMYTITVNAEDNDGKNDTAQIKIQVDNEKITKEDAFFTAHRGLRSRAPENSIPAFTLAGQTGFDSIETDVNETKDGVFVLSHDENLKAVCGVDVNISDLTYEELCDFTKYHIIKGNGVNNYSAEELKIPRVEEFLDICQQYGCIPQLDTKNLNSFESVQELYNILEERNIENDVIVTSFNNLYLQLLREMNSEIILTYGIETTDVPDIEWLRKYDVGVSVSSGKIASMNLNEYKTDQIDINVYSVTNRARLESLIADGITSFTVDDILWDEE